jgi:(1->4)-alpha-D-glucan 1-alpha-D-glucosylmutase
MIFQQLVGSWPVDPDRFKGAVLKNLREAKVHSTWAMPDKEYEDAVMTFVENALDQQESNAFLTAFLPFQENVARLGAQNSLVQTVLKLTAPGVPDIYQGSELWNLSLVDPDNRRPVDYGTRACLLQREPPPLRDLLRDWQDGAVKLQVTHRILRFRGYASDLFALGDYRPLTVTGPKADCVCAFERRHESESVVVAVARFPGRREADSDWAGTTIAMPANADIPHMSDLLTDAEVPVVDGQLQAAAVFRDLPVAVLRP